MTLVNFKTRKDRQQSAKKESKAPILSDVLDDDVLAKLKTVKIELTKVAKENELEHQKKLRSDRKAIEKNKSFEDLLNEHEGFNSK